MSRKLTLNVTSEAEFFRKGRELAKLADAGKSIPQSVTLSFTEPEELSRLLTSARIALFKAVKAQPDSISAIATRLHRDRSAVKRDVDILKKAGVIKVSDVVSSGHGRKKLVYPVASEMRLEAVFV